MCTHPDNSDSMDRRQVHPDERDSQESHQKLVMARNFALRRVSWQRMALEITRAFGVNSSNGSNRLVISSEPRLSNRSSPQLNLRIQLTTWAERCVLESKVVLNTVDGGDSIADSF